MCVGGKLKGKKRKLKGSVRKGRAAFKTCTPFRLLIADTASANTGERVCRTEDKKRKRKGTTPPSP